MNFCQRNPDPRSRRLRRAVTEVLEARRLLSLTLDGPDATLAISGTAGEDNISLDVSGGFFQVTLNGFTTPYSMAGITTITISGLGGNDVLNVERNAGVTTYLYGGDGSDTIHMSYYAENLGNVNGPCFAYGDAGSDAAIVWDRFPGGDQTYTIDYLYVSRPGFGSMWYATNVESLTLYPTAQAATTNIPSTDLNTRVHVKNGGGVDTVNIGANSGGLQAINGEVRLENLPGAVVDVNINDTGNAAARTGSLDYDPDSYSILTGLAPASIVWGSTGVDDVRITTGAGADTMNVLGTLHKLFLNSAGGLDRVNVGNNYAGVQKIGNLLQVDNSPSYTTLLIDDGTDTTARTAVLDVTSIGGNDYNVLTGLSPGTIQYDSVDMDQVTIRAGSGADTLNIRRSTEVLIITNGQGNDTVNLGNPTNGVQGITGPLHVGNPPAYTTLNISDAGDATARPNIRLDVDGPRGTLTGLAPALISWNTGDIGGQGITLTTGNIADTVTVARLQTGIRLTDAAGGADLVRIGDPTLGTAQISATIVVDNPAWYTQVAIDDQAGVTPRAVTFDYANLGGVEYGLITGFGAAGSQVLYKLADTLSPVVYRSGGGDDTFTIARAKTVGLQVFGGSGNDDFYISNNVANDVSQIDANVTLTGDTGVDECWILDSAAMDNGGFTVHGAIIQRPGMADLNCYGMDNLYLYGGGGAAKAHRIVDTLPGYAVYLYDGPSVDHIYVEQTSGAPVYLLQTSLSDWLDVGYNATSAPATVLLPANVTYLDHINFGRYGLVQVGLPSDAIGSGQRVLVLKSALFNEPDGRIDVGPHSLVFEYDNSGTPYPDLLFDRLRDGYSGGTWDGYCLTTRHGNASQYALGYADSTDVLGPSGGMFHGVPVDSTAVLVSFTRYGDTNLDRTVNIADFSRLGSSFNNTGTSWFRGNFNYDNATNIADFSLLAGNFNLGLPGMTAEVFGDRLIDELI